MKLRLLDGNRPRRVYVAGAALLIAVAVLAVWLEQRGSQAVSWESLLAPYSQGTPLPDRFRIEKIRRGSLNDVIIFVDRPGDTATIEVHVLPRGRWTGIRESQSFGIAYETPHSSASEPEREAVTEALAQAIRSRDHGLPSPDAIPLGPSFDSILPWWVQQGEVAVGGIQLAWAVLILASPILCWRGARVAGLRSGSLLIVVSVSAAVALAAIWHRPDEPLHANGHAWREAREVLAPWGVRANGAALFLHGRGGISLQWLLASIERTLTGTANPFRISRLASAAAAGATAFLAAILVRSPWAGLAAGCCLALMPLAQALALSGSALAIPAWIMPWSLGLLVVAGLSADRLLLAGAALAAALGTLSHTAMLAWPPALFAAWFVVAWGGFRRSRFALSSLLVVAVAWVLQAIGCFDMIASRNGGSGVGLLGSALIGFLHRNLMADPQWVSPVLLPMALLWVAAGRRRERLASVAASVLALLLVATPFFAVVACSSDAVRYQGALLGMVTSIAVAGLWEMPFSTRLGKAGVTLLRSTLLAPLVLLPPASWQPPTDPAAIEHRLVVEAVRRMEPGTLVVLPEGHFDGQIIPDFPDFLLPKSSYVAFEGDPAIDAHRGPRLIYLGLACISWDGTAGGSDVSDVRPECRALRGNAHPLLVRSLRPEDLPRSRRGEVWTFHRLATGVPFGFFAPD